LDIVFSATTRYLVAATRGLVVAFRVFLNLAPVVSSGMGGQCSILSMAAEPILVVALLELAWLQGRRDVSRRITLKNHYSSRGTTPAPCIEKHETCQRACYGRTMHDDRCSSSSFHVSGCETRSTRCADRGLARETRRLLARTLRRKR
jgi:hypothetical protein